MGLSKDSKHGYFYVEDVRPVAATRDFYQDAFYSDEKPSYLESVSREIEYWQSIWSIRLKLIEESLSGRGCLLDVGAGGGFFVHYAHELGWQAEGIEPSKDATRYAKNELGVNIFQGFLEDYESDKQFDAIHSSLVLEHVHDPVEFIRSSLALLRTGGVLWLEVPNDFNPLQMAITHSLAKEQWWVVPDHHINYFSFDSLSSLLGQFEVEEVDRLASFPLEMFPLMGMDYLSNAEVGKDAHKMRMTFEMNLAKYAPDALLTLYRGLASAGCGRTCNIMVKKL